jgi:type IV pilus biogenesis protein CpaD/CtpE
MNNMTRQLIFFCSFIGFLSGCQSIHSLGSSISSEDINKQIQALSEHESKRVVTSISTAAPATLTLRKMDAAITDEQAFVIKTFIQLHQQQLFSLAHISVPIGSRNYAVMGTMLSNARVIKHLLEASDISSEIMINPTAAKSQIVLTLLEGSHYAQ